MKPLAFLLTMTALTSLGTQAFADDSGSQATPTKHQTLQECIEKQKTADVNMSKSEMNRICKDELKREKQSGVTPPPPTDTPRDPA
jgi:hypothetical protein